MIYSIVFDWKRTLYDPDNKTLINGGNELLEWLAAKQLTLVLIGKGGDDMYKEVERLGVDKYFSNIIFQEGKKDMSLFASFISKKNPRETFFIGDRVRSELEVGNKLAATTIWVKQGKFAVEDPQNDQQKPTYIVSSLSECREIIEKSL